MAVAVLAVGVLACSRCGRAPARRPRGSPRSERSTSPSPSPRVASWLERYPPDPTTSATFREETQNLGRQGLVRRGRADRAGGRRRHHGDRQRGADRPAGRLGDGARGRGLVRRQDAPEAVRLAGVLPRLLRRARRPAPAVLPAKRRPARPPLVLRLARLLRPRGDLRERSARLPGARLPARAERLGGSPQAGGRASARLADLGLRGGGDLPSRISRRPQRRGATRSDRRRARGCRRREPDSGRRGAVREHAAAREISRSAGRRTRTATFASGSRRTGAARRRSSVEIRTGRSRTSAYVPATLVFAWSGKWDSLPGAHATSILFDLLTILGLGLVGLRFGGARLAAMLAFAWCAYPFTAYTLNANTNDTIMPAFLVFGFWLASSAWARGDGGRAGRVDEVRWTAPRAALGQLPDPRAASPRAFRPRVRARDPRLVRHPAARAGSSGGDPHVLEPHRRLPGRTRLPVLALGLGPVPRGGNPRPRVPAAGRRRFRRRSGGRRSRSCRGRRARSSSPR